MTKRRRARECALQLLFQNEYLEDKVDFELYWKDKSVEQEVRDFATSLYRGAIKFASEIDAALSECTDNWEMDRLATVDRAILREAAYEILFRKDIPYAVTINEALEIAKKYSTTESSAFINGILDRLAKKSRAEQSGAETREQEQ